MTSNSRLMTLPLVTLMAATGCSADTGEQESVHVERVHTSDIAKTDGLQFDKLIPNSVIHGSPPSTISLLRELGDSSQYFSPMIAVPLGNELWVSDQFTDPHLSLISLETGEITQRFGPAGNKPGQFRHPDWISPASPERPGAWVYDFENRRMSLLGVLDDGNIIVHNEVDLQINRSVEQPLWIGSQIIGNGIFPDHSLVVMDSHGQPVLEIDADPPYTPETVPHTTGRSILNRTHLVANPSRTRLALVHQYKSRIDLFNSQGARYGIIRGPRSTTPDFEIRDGRFFEGAHNEVAYGAAAATEQYVYALFCGCGEEVPDKMYIHVFTWDGEFVSEIATDRPLGSIAISDDDRILYGTTPYPQAFIGEWLLPQLQNTDQPLEERTS